MSARTLGATLVLGLAAAACGESDGGPLEGMSSALADFSLRDDNPTSPSSGQNVSPRDFLMKVSGWYFTHAT